MSLDDQPILASIKGEFLDFLEGVPDAMVLSDHKGRIVLMNSNAERMFGYSRGELIDREVEILMPSQFRTRHRHNRATYYANPSMRPMGIAQLLSALRKDGTEFRVEINLSPVEIGGHHLVWSAIRNVSDREPIFAQFRSAVESALISLRGLIAICAWCNRILDERGLWQQLERFIELHSEAKFTHAMCPDCLRKLDPSNHQIEKV
jgi:PAS domain S-box-containing protein